MLSKLFIQEMSLVPWFDPQTNRYRSYNLKVKCGCIRYFMPRHRKYSHWFRMQKSRWKFVAVPPNVPSCTAFTVPPKRVQSLYFLTRWGVFPVFIMCADSLHASLHFISCSDSISHFDQSLSTINGDICRNQGHTRLFLKTLGEKTHDLILITGFETVLWPSCWVLHSTAPWCG